jgi:predicted esterase
MPAAAGDPHRGLAIAAAGAPLAEARAAAILVHGRGGSARDILGLAAELDRPGVAWLAPQAAGNSWYPESFLAPLGSNQPHLDSALAALARIVDRVADEGPGVRRLALIGFSQGACLALELAARRARRFGAVAGLTGGLIGPPGTARDYPGSLAGTPVLLAAGDPDPHVPWSRVEESAAVFTGLGAAVDLRRYPGLPHSINADEIERLDELLAALVDGGGVSPRRSARGAG